MSTNQTPHKRYFIRIVWSGEPHIVPEDGDSIITKETLGTFSDDYAGPLEAINGTASKIVQAGAYITEMHYVAAMECSDEAIENQVRKAEPNLVTEFDGEYINRCLSRSKARANFIEKAAIQRAEAVRGKS
jgi:hypothetical protein